jgi:hypothetical protein
MAQKLSVEVNSADGKKSIRTVMVIRAWQDNSGSMIMLYANGSYGYKNGEPVISEREFDVITSPVQRQAAKAWWNRTGQDLSAAYYAAKDRREAELAGDFRQVTGADSELDMVLYTRTPSGDDGSEPEGPFSWPELFAKRPDWWGQAMSIRFGDYTYEQAEAGAAGTPAMETPPEEKLEKAEAKRAAQGSGKGKKEKAPAEE